MLGIVRDVEPGSPKACPDNIEAHQEYLSTLCQRDSYWTMLMKLPLVPVRFLIIHMLLTDPEEYYQDITRAVATWRHTPAWVDWKKTKAGLPYYFYTDDGMDEIAAWMTDKPYKGSNYDEITHKCHDLAVFL